jgi:DNA-binding transcriptional regulator/RsmH inhibitor MraZ
VIAGVLNKIEIWPKEVYDAQLKAAMEGKEEGFDLAKMTEEAFALLGEDESEDSVSDAAKKLAELKDNYAKHES